ncbi:MAG: InlB B-repeat-containing protein [Lachnospiraceae bacterium]|nr:InlB B-repeat-containing protein [Lachnospiraceae bacterium]
MPATTLTYYCYNGMFKGCTSLEEAPELPATTLANSCYYNMFNNCAGIKLSEIENDEYSIPYRVPASGDGITANKALSNMFSNTGGTFKGTPDINTTYYMKPRVKTYTATFDTNGGTGTMADVTGLNGEWTLPDCGFTAPSGKVFDQWEITQSSSEASVESQASTYKKPGETYNVNGDITVKALWKEVAAIATSPAAKNLSYTGSEQELVTTGTTTDGTVYYALGSDASTAPADNQYNTVIPKGINVGPYYVYYKVVGDDTHADSAVMGPVTVTIGKGTITPTVNITGWTYGETASTPSVSGNLGSGNVTYTYSTSENGTYTSTVPTNAGTYYIKANVSETANYNTAVSAPVSFTIAKKALTDAMLTLGTSAFVHDGNTKTPSYTVTDGTKTLIAGTDYTVDSTSTTSASAYGTYTIKVNGTGNYTGSASKAWNINDETNPSATISIENNSFTSMLNAITFGLFFNKTETVSINAVDLESGVSKIEYVTTDTVATSKTAIDQLTGWTTVNGSTASFSRNPESKFIVYVRVTDNAGNVGYVTSNGITLETTVPVITVDDAEPKTSYNKAVSWSVTDSNLKDIAIDYTAEGSTGTQTVYSQNATGTTLSSSVNLSDLGTYKITATDKAGNVTEKTFTIARRSAVITGKNETTTYVAEQTYDVSNLFTFENGLGVKNYQIVANDNTEALKGEGTLAGNALTITKAGLITVKVTALSCTTDTATPEFIRETTKTATLLVSKAEGNAYISIEDVVYGDSIEVTTNSSNTGVDKKITYTLVKDSAGNDIAEGSQIATEEEPVNAGTYKAEVVYPANDLYKEAKAGIMFSIAKAEAAVSAPVAKDLTYTGEAQALVTKAITEDGIVNYSLDGETYVEAIPNGVDAGEYTVYYKVLGDENHKDSESATVTAEIKKAAADDITLKDEIVVISSGVKDEKIDLSEYLKEGYKVINADKTGDLAEYITAEDFGDGTFAYSVSENAGGISGIVVLTIGSTNYKDYTITINVVSKKRITEVILESDDVEETDVKDVTVPELEKFTESQPEAAVEVTMEVNIVNEETVKNEEGEKVLEDIQNLIENAYDGMDKKDLNQEFLDITILKSVNGGEQEAVKELNRVVGIELKYNLTGKYNPIIFRAHNGIAEQLRRLSAKPEEGKYTDGTFFVSGSGTDAVIYIYSSRFSTYTLAYSTTISYQVTFDDMQNNINQVVVADGNKVSKPTDPTREGYTFEGWYVEGSTEKYDFDKAINGDLTLVAKWKEVEKTTPAPAPAKTTTTTTSSNSPKTGDTNNYYGFWMLLASAGFVASYMALKRSRKEI